MVSSSLESPDQHDQQQDESGKPLVSLILPAFNEAGILERNLSVVREYTDTLADQYRWEFIIVNDGSSDTTGELADAFAATHDNVRVVHHGVNGGLGRAFSSGFRACAGDYVITMDIDLSYAPDHIERLLTKLKESRVEMVLASPYMKGGKLSSVPWLRRIFSICANRFLALISSGHLSTITCMVRGYRGDFVRSMNLRAVGMEVMPEMVYKTMILRGKNRQIPAHLDWGMQIKDGAARQSSMRVVRHIFSTLLSGFIFRPFMFLVLPGLILFSFSMYVNLWMVIHFVTAYADIGSSVGSGRAAVAVANAYKEYPHTFIVGLLSLMLSIQLISLGVLALQSKNYFEEIFYLGSKMRELQDKNEDTVK